MKNARFIEVSAGVRYWEDATLNGIEDAEGKMPFRTGDLWRPIIELTNGRILNWPDGVEADIHYKVCDDGEYWLLNNEGRRIAKHKSYYVPNSILCVGGNGYGDYIIFKVGGDGLIVGWRNPNIDDEDWGAA